MTRSTRLPALLLGVPIDNMTMDDAVDAIGDLVASGRRQTRTHQVATVNVDFLVNAVTHAPTLRLLQAADLCLADGTPVVWAAKASGMAVRERVAGVDLVPALAARASWHIHLFGSSPGIAEAAAELLRERYPGSLVTGCSGPMMRDVGRIDDEVLDEITRLDPDILCVALGNPKQEQFIDLHRDRLKTPVMIGVGGTFDVLTGGKERAPNWVQRIGFEWVVRLAQEPRRLAHRYLRDARIFFPRAFVYIARLRRSSKDGDVSIDVDGSRVTVGDAQSSKQPIDTMRGHRATEVLASGGTLAVDLGATGRLRPFALSELVTLIRVARRASAPVVIGKIGFDLRRQMTELGLSSYLDHATAAPEASS
jgi:exopolysaccharide biosynthesis WecB/TagA/CpsF family protein